MPYFHRAESRSQFGVESESHRSQVALSSHRPIFYRAESRSQFGVNPESIRSPFAQPSPRLIFIGRNRGATLESFWKLRSSFALI